MRDYGLFEISDHFGVVFQTIIHSRVRERGDYAMESRASENMYIHESDNKGYTRLRV